MSDYRIPALAALSVAAYGLVSCLWSGNRRNTFSHPLPPGPKRLPVIGNVLGIDPKAPWASYTNWAKIYGDLVYSRLLNQDVIVINSEEVAKDLLERRSGNYSDRPAIVRMTNDFFGWAFNTVMAPYSDRWRLHRRLFHQTFRSEAALDYHPIQLEKAHDLVHKLLETPENYVGHIQTHSTAIIMSVVYGYEIVHQDDPIINVVDKAVSFAVSCIRPEIAAILGFFPFLRYIPTWVPGASLRRSALLSIKYTDDMVETPFQFVQQSIAAGTAIPSMVSNLLSRVKGQDQGGEHVLAVKESSATAFAAASETTASTLLTFILVMLHNPDVQARAQAEIDSVVGTERLPVFEDRSSLPYVDAILRETLRWHPTVPLGVPHATMSADVYGGYFIPEGATIIMNTWAMTRNEAKYADPERFHPERFFTKDGELNDDTMTYAFGAGRRICVGRHIADASLWSAIVSILAIFTIMPCKDERGNDINVNPKWTAGITSHPLHFPCRFVPRAPGGLTAEKLAQLF